MNGFKSLLIFLLGAAVGSASTYLLIKSKYESAVENEVQEIRDAYRKTLKSDDIPEETDEEQEHSTTHERSSLDQDRKKKVETDSEKIPPEDYTRFYKPSDIVVEEPKHVGSHPIQYRDPYVISPNDFGEDPSYEEMHLVLNPNGIITDEETGDEIEDYVGLLGTEWEGSMGEYEINTVRIRNERLGLDIEIIQTPAKPIPENPTIIVAGPSGKRDSRRPHQVEKGD